MCVHSFDKPYPWISANLVPITPLRLCVGFQTKAACRQFRLLFHLHFQMQYILIYFFLANQFVITKANKDETVKMNLIWGFLSNNISFLIIFFFGLFCGWGGLWGVVFGGVLEGFFWGGYLTNISFLLICIYGLSNLCRLFKNFHLFKAWKYLWIVIIFQ